jgi:hypothetical protein
MHAITRPDGRRWSRIAGGHQPVDHELERLTAMMQPEASNPWRFKWGNRRLPDKITRPPFFHAGAGCSRAQGEKPQLWTGDHWEANGFPCLAL